MAAAVSTLKMEEQKNNDMTKIELAMICYGLVRVYGNKGKGIFKKLLINLNN